MFSKLPAASYRWLKSLAKQRPYASCATCVGGTPPKRNAPIHHPAESCRENHYCSALPSRCSLPGLSYLMHDCRAYCS